MLRLAGDIRWYLALTAALGLAVTTTYVLQGILLAPVLAEVFAGGALPDTGAAAGGYRGSAGRAGRAAVVARWPRS